jgi:hypothetical protein
LSIGNTSASLQQGIITLNEGVSCIAAMIAESGPNLDQIFSRPFITVEHLFDLPHCREI